MISTRGRYALRVMVDLAKNSQNEFITLKDIAKRQDISKKYLEQIIPIFNRENMLIASRGYGGGYKLSKSPKEYTVGEILRLTESSLAPVACLETKTNQCPRADSCPTLFVWQGLQKVEEEYLNSITLQDILDREIDLSGNNYNI